MITSGRARTRTYRITGVSPRRHAATDDFADALRTTPTCWPDSSRTRAYKSIPMLRTASSSSTTPASPRTSHHCSTT